MSNYLKSIVILVIFINFLGCNNNEKIDKVKKDLEQTIQKANKNIQELTSEYANKDKLNELTTEEVEKLFTYEYKVLELDNSLSASEIEEQLQTLGKERWECFNVISEQKSYKVFCKRKPKTYLRYIPRVF